MFFIGQYLKEVHMTYSFFKLLIFFWLTLVDVWIQKQIFSLVLDIDNEKSCF